MVCVRDLTLQSGHATPLFSYVAHFVQTLVQSREGHKPNPAETEQAFPYIHVDDNKQNKKEYYAHVWIRYVTSERAVPHSTTTFPRPAILAMPHPQPRTKKRRTSNQSPITPVWLSSIASSKGNVDKKKKTRGPDYPMMIRTHDFEYSESIAK